MLAGLVVRFPIKRITIGTGRELIKRDIAGALLVITSGFSGGFTNIGSVSGRFFKARFAFFVLGGVFAEGLAIALTMALFKVRLFEFPTINTLSVAHVFVYSNLFSIALNLLPRKLTILGMPIQNDGLRITKLPFLKESGLQEIIAAGEVMEAYELFEAKQFCKAEIGFKECIDHYPSLLIPKINLSAVYLKQSRFDEAIAFLETCIEEYAHDEYSFLLYNNLAWVYLIRNEGQDLQKADQYSEKAFEENDKIPCIINTRGCVLLEKGDIDNGITLLAKTVNINRAVDEKTNTPASFIALAYGYYINNKIQEALKYIKKVESDNKNLDADDQVFFDHVISKTENFNREKES